jgi:hypothetical protein
VPPSSAVDTKQAALVRYRVTHRLPCLIGLAAAIFAAVPVSAQVTTLDSAGIAIVTSTAPTRPRDALVLTPTPRINIGGDSSAVFRGIHRVVVLSDGQIVAVERASGELRYFDKSGIRLLRRVRMASGQNQSEPVRRVGIVGGDTLALAVGRSTVIRFDARGVQLDSGPAARPSGPPREILTDVMPSGHQAFIVITAPEQRALGEIWHAEAPFRLLEPQTGTASDLGPHPMLEIEQTRSGPVPRWLGPIGAMAGGTTRVYLGYGARYEARAYDHTGRLRTIIRRTWTPVPITDADWETWVVEWSKRWITSTGDQRTRDVQAVRESPWAEQLPAFSQFMVDRTDRLWVRAAHWQDAIAAGNLNDAPVVQSEWSVFDTDGTWLYDVTMPPHFEPMDIGADYVAGRLRSGGRDLAVVFGLVRATP